MYAIRLVVFISCLAGSVANAAFIPAAIQYQGRLLDGTNLYNGPATLSFQFYTAPAGGALVYQETQSVSVVDGLYEVRIGASNTAAGGLFRALQNTTNQPWLEVSVNGTALVPREPVLSVAFAMHAGSTWNIDGNRGLTTTNHFLGTIDNIPLEFRANNQRALAIYPRTVSPNLIAGHSNNAAAAGVYGAVIAGGGFFVSPNTVASNFAFIGGGFSNRAAGWASVVAGGANQESRSDFTAIGGGVSNRADGVGAAVFAGIENRALRPRAYVGGGEDNLATGEFAVVSGGSGNRVEKDYGMIGGGDQNTVRADFGVISGGQLNVVTGSAAAVLGGLQNAANSFNAAVLGGSFNTASGDGATVAGGYNNAASGLYAITAGGEENLASGNFSLAAGRKAKATHDGSFVWADANGSDLTSSANNQWTVRASGGVRFYSDENATGGVELVSGSTGWSATSDQRLKENIVPVDPVEILESLAAVPISRWNLKGQSPENTQIGPMAQDFHQAFALGGPDTMINSVNADGISMAAIQGLYRKILELEAENARIRARLQELEAAQP